VPACLESIRWIDDIVVVDDHSADATREICTRAGARVVVRESQGNFDAQRNMGIDAARGGWVFQLDADEVVPDALRDEILKVLQAPGPIVAYRIRRLNHFLGRQMHAGGWSWKGVKLFKKSAARYVGHSVHETLAVEGPLADLEHPIYHYPYQTLTQLMERANFYSDVEARLLREQHPVQVSRVLRHQLFIRPLKLFWKAYFKQSGWRDGMHGLIYGAFSAWVHFLTWAKYWALGLPRPTSEPAGRVGKTPPTPAVASRGRARLSVVILTKNEEGKIARCLESVRWADEIVVVDGLSADRTVEICRSFGVTVVPHAFDGSFASDRNLGMAHAHGDWVLQIDADDIVTAEFRDAVERVLRSDVPHAAFKFRRRSVLLGRVMRHGGWYYSVPNLLRRDRARYEGLVHERPKVDGTIGDLAADVEHHPCNNLADFVTRHNRYTSLQAEEMFRTLGVQPIKRIRRLIWKKSWKTFWKSYVKKGGYREGFHGLVFAEFYAGVELMKWAKYWELTQRAAPNDG